MASNHPKRLFSTAIVCACVVIWGLYTFHTFPGIDFYQFWGVGMANRLSEGELTNPYVQVARYGMLLDGYSSTSDDGRLQFANALNHDLNAYGLDVNSTPLLLTVFSFMPDDYSLAFGLFSAARTASLLGAIIILIYSLRLKEYLVLSVLPLLVFFYEPLRLDAFVGNLNVFQLLSVIAVVSFLERRRKERAKRDVVVPVMLWLCAVILLAFIKPNFLLVCLALAVSLAVLEGPRVFIPAAMGAAAFGLVLWALPCLYFRTWSVWADWFRYLAVGGGKLSYEVWKYNYSPSQVLWEVFHFPIGNSIMVLAILLGLSLGVVVFVPRQGEHVVARLLGYPHLSAAVAITVTLALSPLVWYHYLTLSLLPALWLLSGPAKCRVCGSMALLSLVLSSGSIPTFVGDAYFPPYVAAAGWLPLWIGILMTIREMRHEDVHDGLVARRCGG